jgi:hypothetical protein
MPIKNFKLKPEVDFTDKYVTSLHVLHATLLKASKITVAYPGSDLGAGIALQLIEEVKGYKLLKIKIQ